MNKQTLIEYFNLDKQIKVLSKERDNMKKDILSFLKSQKNNTYRFENVLAYLQQQDRKTYNVPDEIKQKYCEIKHYDLQPHNT